MYDPMTLVTRLISSFVVDEMQSMIWSICMDRLSKPSNVNRMAGRGAAMATTRGPRKVRIRCIVHIRVPAAHDVWSYSGMICSSTYASSESTGNILYETLCDTMDTSSPPCHAALPPVPRSPTPFDTIDV